MPNDGPPNFGPGNGRYSDYPPNPRNRNNDPNRPPYPPDSLPSSNQKPSPSYYDDNRPPPPSDRYYDEYNNNRNNNENRYRYRNESKDKLNGEGYNPPENIGMNRPISPVSLNTPPSSRNDYILSGKRDPYDNNNDNNSKRLKQPYYYSNSSSPNHSRNVNHMGYGEPPVKTNIKYISSPMTSDINPRVSNMNINENRNNGSNRSNTIRNPPNANFDTSPNYRNPNKNYPPDDRYYKDSDPRSSGISSTGNRNTSSIQPPPPPPMDSIKDGYSDPNRAPRDYNQDKKYPPRSENGPSKFYPPHQLTSPHNSQNMVSNNPPNRNFANDSSKRPPNYSPSPSSGGSQTDPNRFSLYKMFNQPNSSRDSPTLPPISSLNNNEVSIV